MKFSSRFVHAMSSPIWEYFRLVEVIVDKTVTKAISSSLLCNDVELVYTGGTTTTFDANIWVNTRYLKVNVATKHSFF